MSELLRAEGVCKYFGGLRAVENVDMEVAQGDVLGIIGPNGAGKTTFFNVCTGIYAPTKGKVYLEDKDISGFSPDKVAACGMARTFQNIQLLAALLKGFDNLSQFQGRNNSFIHNAKPPPGQTWRHDRPDKSSPKKITTKKCLPRPQPR